MVNTGIKMGEFRLLKWKQDYGDSGRFNAAYTLLNADIFYGTTKDTATAEFGFKFGKISLPKLGSL